VDDVTVRPIEDRDLGAVLAMCRAEGWPSYADEEVIGDASRSPGSIGLVAEATGEVVGFAHAQSDGRVEAHLSLLVVAAAHRRSGVARALVAGCFARAGTDRLDLVADGDGAEAFYRSLPHRELRGFRLYPPA
jgi:ribosomal protein S18 acetylase RimI-like enzyme